jgi:putative copper resistance protein D
VITPLAALAISRALHYAVSMALFGSSVLLRRMRPGALSTRIGMQLRYPMIVAAGLAWATLLLWLPLQSAIIGVDWNAATNYPMLAAVMLHTHSGHAWIARALIGGVTLGIVWFAAPRRPGLIAAASGVLLVTLALNGHAAMQEGATGWLHGINHAVHVLCAGAWFGSLIPFLACLKALRNPLFRMEARDALTAFSNAGHVAVAGVLVTGTINTMLVLDGWPVHWQSQYQALLACKIGVTAVMVDLAVVNRYIWVPAINKDAGRSLDQIRNSTIVEIVLGISALSLVSVFGLLEPT